MGPMDRIELFGFLDRAMQRRPPGCLILSGGEMLTYLETIRDDKAEWVENRRDAKRAIKAVKSMCVSRYAVPQGGPLARGGALIGTYTPEGA